MTDNSTVIVCWTVYDTTRFEMEDCPTCKTKRMFLCQHQDYYGWTETCLTCGDAWEDGERLSRPFAPKWRSAMLSDVVKRLNRLVEKAPDDPLIQVERMYPNEEVRHER